jgi:4-hydroxy-3-methylbut-2-enyl diphosphate reductase
MRYNNIGDTMKTIKITPRGYCHGVVGAINTITNLDFLSIPNPVYILGMLVHNKEIIKHLDKLGIITLHDPSKSRMELLEEIQSGTVIFTAHGISPLVKEKAISKGLHVIDTSCQDVLHSQDVVREYINKDYHVFFIGKKGHPESEAALDISHKVHLIESKQDIQNLKDINKVAVTNQTTMSLYDVFDLSEYTKKIINDVIIIDEICNATRIRQEAIIAQDKVDHCFIVGDKLSNNSNKLVQVSIEKAGIPASLIENIEQLDIELLKTLSSCSVSSGASTPTQVTTEVIHYLEQFDKTDPTTFKKKQSVDQNFLFMKKS